MIKDKTFIFYTLNSKTNKTHFFSKDDFGAITDVTDILPKKIKDKMTFFKKNGIFENDDITLMENNNGMSTFSNNSNSVDKTLLRMMEDVPEEFFIEKEKWSILMRNVYRSKNTMLTGGTGTGKTSLVAEVARILKRPFFKIPLGSTQEPRTTIIGTTVYIEGEGTKFIESNFLTAIQTENAVILLDEFTRINPEAENILFPILDHQRFIVIDEDGGRIVNVADNVAFIATANIGSSYTGTRKIDRATVDRFIKIELPYLSKTDEYNLLTLRNPTAKKEDILGLCEITNELRRNAEKDEDIYGGEVISTRRALEIIEMTVDGIDLITVLKTVVAPEFENIGENSARLAFMGLIDKHINIAIKKTRKINNRTTNTVTKKNIFDGF